MFGENITIFMKCNESGIFVGYPPPQHTHTHQLLIDDAESHCLGRQDYISVALFIFAGFKIVL